MTPQTVRAHLAYWFSESLGESFSRHIRALERGIREQLGIEDFDGIHVVMRSQLPIGAAGVGVYAHPVSGALSIFIGVGTGGLYQGADPPKGRVAKKQRHISELRVRLALACEVGHVALGHCIDPKTTSLKGREVTPEEDCDAELYAIGLVHLISSFFVRKGPLAVDPKRLLEVAAEMWPTLRTSAEHWGLAERMVHQDNCIDLINDAVDE